MNTILSLFFVACSISFLCFNAAYGLRCYGGTYELIDDSAPSMSSIICGVDFEFCTVIQYDNDPNRTNHRCSNYSWIDELNLESDVGCMELIEGETVNVTEDGVGCACRHDNCNSQILLQSIHEREEAEEEISPRKSEEKGAEEEESENSERNVAANVVQIWHSAFLHLAAAIILFFSGNAAS